MEIDRFAEKLSGALEKELGTGYHVERRKVRKNNGIVMEALLVFSRDQNLAPTIYLNSFLEAYRLGMPFQEIVKKALTVIGESKARGSVDMDFFRFFDKVRDRICYRLIGRKGNEGMLEEVPHIEFLDLALCFFYSYQDEILGEGAVLVHESHMQMWGAATAELMKLAECNTPRLYPWKKRSMESMLAELSCEDGAQGEISPGMPMSVLSNDRGIYGAACVVYPGVLEAIGAEKGAGFYIIPSSIHEVILLEDSGGEDSQALRQTIEEVNRTQLAPEEILSDNLYYYDFFEKRIKII